MFKEAEGGQALATGVIRCIVQHQHAASGWELLDEELLQKDNEGAAVLLLAHAPGHCVVGPVVGGKDVVRLLYARCGHQRLPAALGSTRPQGRMQTQAGFVHKEQPEIVCACVFLSASSVSCACALARGLGGDAGRAWAAAGHSHQRTTTETVYGITSLALQVAPPPRLLHFIRQYWQIENRLHWRRDVTLGEDACTASRGQTPRVLATLNNVILALADRLGVTNLARPATYLQRPSHRGARPDSLSYLAFEKPWRMEADDCTAPGAML